MGTGVSSLLMGWAIMASFCEEQAAILAHELFAQPWEREAAAKIIALRMELIDKRAVQRCVRQLEGFGTKAGRDHAYFVLAEQLGKDGK